jgi:hypothetical protein
MIWRQIFWQSEGTPQGGILSPLFSNLYAREVDTKLRALKLVSSRYADNLLVAYPADKNREWILEQITKVLPAGIELNLGPDKTRWLEGLGHITTLGCVLDRTIDGIRLYINEGYVGRPSKARQRKALEYGVGFSGLSLRWVRNLPCHLPYAYLDRRIWNKLVRAKELNGPNPVTDVIGRWVEVPVNIRRLPKLPTFQVWEGKVRA